MKWRARWYNVPIPNWVMAFMVISTIAWLSVAAYIAGTSIRAHEPTSAALPMHPLDCDEPFYDKGVPVVLCHESGRIYRITEDNAP